jgi:hypothetical protein
MRLLTKHKSKTFQIVDGKNKKSIITIIEFFINNELSKFSLLHEDKRKEENSSSSKSNSFSTTN